MAIQSAPPDSDEDVWSKWLHSRDGGSAAYGALLRTHLEAMRDRVLSAAKLHENMTLLDVGTGDGLLALGAIDRVGPTLNVIATDVSAPMVRYVQRQAEQRGVAGQCKFFVCPAEAQDELWDHSVDVVITRAALAFVPDKQAAFREFARVLKPGGRISLAEPILQDQALQVIALERLIRSQPAPDNLDFLRLLYRLKAAQFPTTVEAAMANPLTNFTERDLIDLANEAGFVSIHLELHIDVRPSLANEWGVHLATSPFPGATTPGELLITRFTAKERLIYERVMRPAIESGKSIATDVFAYLTADKWA